MTSVDFPFKIDSHLLIYLQCEHLNSNNTHLFKRSSLNF